jgi:phosphatidylserine/phosphatidylglycerophosphate/cardiolipin synthase-like enzyme
LKICQETITRGFEALYCACLKALPANLSLEGEPHQVTGAEVEFLYDVTGMKDGRRVSQQMIFDRALGLIRGAQDFLLVDFFLFNDYLGTSRTAHRKLCDEVSTALVEKKRSRPDIRMVVITDPLNEAYGGSVSPQFTALRAAGIPVVLTDLRKLRDSNPIYSAFWRMFVQWFGTSVGGPLPHPLSKDAGGVGVRSWLTLLNFKANHRKLIVADAPAPAGGRHLVSMVISANPHDGSSAHSNVGLLVRGGIWKDLLQSERAVLAFSAPSIDPAAWVPSYARTQGTGGRGGEQGPEVTVRVLTEEKIRKGLLELWQGVRNGDQIDIGMFYLSDRSVIKALLAAAQRGAVVRVLLDPNRDAFGYQKNGIPNRPVAAELVQGGDGKIAVRWCKTHGEQFHTKMVLVKQAGNATLFVGSANLTRRNLGDFNLETDVVVAGARSVPAIRAAEGYFERVWANQDLECSVPYETFADASRWKYWLYRFQERTGTATF